MTKGDANTAIKRMIFVILCLFFTAIPILSFPEATINIQTKIAIHTTNSMYFSLGMDSNLVRNRWETFDFSSNRLMTLAQNLAPAYLRLMGTDGDRMSFSFNKSNKAGKGFFFPNTNFIITAMDWDLINKFCLKAGWRLLFGFNAQIRQKAEHGTCWDPSNAKEILDYSIKMGYNKNLDFELGNEPIAYTYRPGWVPVSMKQLAQDFNSLKKLLDDSYSGYYNKSLIVGPDFAVLTQQRVSDFLNTVDDFLSAMTFHQYYGGGNLKYKENYTDPNILDSYILLVKAAKQYVMNSDKSNMKIWNGETSSTVDPSGTGLEESFAGVFMLMEKYGISAQMGLDLVVRQTFFGFWFALVDAKLEPTPNYWVSWYYKNLVGQKVLNVTVAISQFPRKIRFYAHCSKDSKLYPQHKGSITVYGMNLFDEDVMIHWNKSILSSLHEIHQYAFTSDDLASKSIFLNEQKLSMISDTEMPKMQPKIRKITDQFIIPAKSVAFYVMPYLEAQACVD